MIVLTEIVQKKKRLAELYCEQGLLCTMDSGVCSDAGLRPGVEVEEERLDELLYLSHKKRAKSKALWLLSRRDYGSRELQRKLSEEAPEEVAKEVVEWLTELHYVDDRRYARAVAEQLICRKHYSPHRAVYDLVYRGVERDIAEEAVEEAEPDVRQSIADVIEKKYLRNLSDERGVRRAVMGLQRLGYRYGEIREVLDDYLEELSEETEWE